ncbi:DUF4468 domain-containing protein [Salegentibacter sp. F188]|uniref:DUF4468 domain-containing protein n=1 Tax=Autumnicola patrickiae TaxID=3075591 RepID=A0ABU3E5C1_9FLAO|nr:DUF4468 domain-containing protein [Salegentibacter sp. F188]MDT0691142.1 DUF4468 domain-containing protein [Salegentibacter sp. F188]
MNKFLLLILFPLMGLAQFKSNDSGHLYYEKVFQVEGMQQKELKDKAYEWIAITFQDADNANKNTDNRIFTNKHLLVYQGLSGAQVEKKINFSIIMHFLDGRYKLLISNLSTQNSPIADNGPLPYASWKEAFEKALENESKNLQKANRRLLRNKKKLRKIYSQGIQVQHLMVEDVKKEILAMAEDLAFYIQKT